MTLMTDAVAPARESVYRPRRPLDLGRTVGMLRRGGTDPTMIVDSGRIWMAFRTDAGIATLCLRQSTEGVHASGWGPGAAEALAVPPTECLVVEDAPAGIRAARAAGMAALGIARLGDEALLRAAGAGLVVTDLDQLDVAALVATGALRARPVAEAAPDA